MNVEEFIMTGGSKVECQHRIDIVNLITSHYYLLKGDTRKNLIIIRVCI